MSGFIQAKDIVHDALTQATNGQKGKARVRMFDFSKLRLSLPEVQKALTELEAENIISNVKMISSEVEYDLLEPKQ